MQNLDDYLNNIDSDYVPFSLSLCRFEEPLHLTHGSGFDELDECGVPLEIESPEHTLEVVRCHGLLHFKHLLETMDDHVAFRPGFPTPEIESRPVFDSYYGHFNEFVCGLLVHSSEFYFYPTDEPALVCFEVDSRYGSPATAWEMLCQIDWNLRKVGYLFAPYGEFDNEGGLRTLKYRFYIVACGDIPSYTTYFTIAASVFHGFNFDFEGYDSFRICQLVDPVSITADHFIHWESRFSAIGITDQASGLKLHSGEILNTREFDEISNLDMYELGQRGIRAFEEIGLISEAVYESVIH
ncbi:hypothetical protein ACFL00_03075 [Pseudomonadota bacterium]